MHDKRRGLRNLGLGLLIGGLCACGQQAAKNNIEFDSMGFEGIDSTHFDILTNTCAIATVGSVTTATITMADNEFAYVFYRTTDSNVVVNAYNAAGTECVFPASAKIAVTAPAGASNATHKILFDFLSGTYALGATGAGNEGINISFTTGQTNLVEIRGSAGIDQITFGSAATGSPLPSYASYAINGAATHAWTDMVMTDVTDVLVSTGPGDDIITGQGKVGSAVNALSGNISMTVYGGDGNDVITSGAGGGTAVNSLYGNAGSDRFPQVAGILAHDIISGGSDQPYTYPQTQFTTSTYTATYTSHLTATGTKTATDTGTGTALRTLTGTNSNTATYSFTQTDISVDVVDYSARTSAIRVTLGDQASKVTASGSISFALPSTIHDHDGFTLNDGSTTTTFEYHNSANTATTGSVIFNKTKANLANLDQFTLNDGVNTPTVFELSTGTTTATPTLTGSFLIDITSASYTTANDVAAKVAAAINAYKTAGGTLNVTASATGATVNITNGDPNAVVATIVNQTYQLSGTADTTSQTTPGVHWVAAASPVVSINIYHEKGGAAGVATDTVNAIASVGTVTAVASGSVVTVTSVTAGLAGNFTMAPKTGSTGFTYGTASTNIIRNIFAGVDTAGANDGDFAGNVSEGDSIAADVEMVIGTSKDDYIEVTKQAVGFSHILQGMAGNDVLIIGVDSVVSNTLYGGPGDDILQGGSGVDTLYGGDGNDSLRGGPGNDIIDGANLNCLAASNAVAYTATTPAKAYIYSPTLVCTSTFMAASATAGKDTLDYSDRTVPVTVDMTTLASPTSSTVIGVGTEQDIVSNCINLRGGSGNDTLTGDANANMIWGGSGNDTINGGPGNDTLYGESGDDTISGNAGDDYIYGGIGTNVIFGDTSGSTTDIGNDLVDNSEGTSGTIDCGPGDMDILIGNGGETVTANSCEM
jgi:Ca2+-binding RTX toxin-like protein